MDIRSYSIIVSVGQTLTHSPARRSYFSCFASSGPSAQPVKPDATESSRLETPGSHHTLKQSPAHRGLGSKRPCARKHTETGSKNRKRLPVRREALPGHCPLLHHTPLPLCKRQGLGCLTPRPCFHIHLYPLQVQCNRCQHPSNLEQRNKVPLHWLLHSGRSRADQHTSRFRPL